MMKSRHALWLIALTASTLAPSTARAQNLFFGSIPVSGAPTNLYTSDLNGGGISDIMPAPASYVTGVAADGAQGLVFWKDHLTGNQYTLHSANLSGGAHSVIWSGAQWGNSYGVALDDVSQRVFWTGAQAIYSANYNGTGLTTVLTSWNPTELEVDPLAGKLFWTESNTSGFYEVRSANLNGTGQQTLYTAPASTFLSGITVNPSTGTLFWSDHTAGEVRSLPYLGGTPTTILSGYLAVAGLDYEPTTNRLYVVNKNSATVSWLSPTGGPLTTVFTGGGPSLGEMWDVSVIVPEPGTFALLALGGLFVALRRR